MNLIIDKKAIIAISLCVGCSLEAYDFNKTYSPSTKNDAKNDYVLLEKQMSAKKEFEKNSENNTPAYDEAHAMRKYFKKIKYDQSCGLTYKYKQKHYFIFSCKNKKRDKTYIFDREYMYVHISTEKRKSFSASNKTADLPIQDIEYCMQICNYSRAIMTCVLKPKL